MTTTLEPGTTVSHYRVMQPLGAGGMGEVYKAHDNHLERTVALKILPPDLVRNDERVRRFIQEAKSASSLNHPHIVTIHEIGDADMPPRIHYIAMEFVDGVTLRHRIHQERIDLRTLLGFLAQAADGLAKAHAAGIVHRDLKPENIMVTRDGFAKVLDFGLAKLIVKTDDESAARTAVRDAQTREGQIVGTVAYMAPEQVLGKVVDHRSDIFAMGAILYEAATRRRPFEADSDVDLMHKIVHDKPVPVDEIDPSVPAELRRLIRRCLAKDPDKRYQSMKDLAIELSEIVDEFDQLSASASSTSGPSAPLVAHRSSRWLWGAMALAVIGLAGIAFGVYQWNRTRGAGSSPVSFASMKIQRLTSSGDLVMSAISPDGRYIAHVVRGDANDFHLRVRQVNTGTDVDVVSSLQTLAGLTFSPDGDYILYSARENMTSAYSWLQQVPTLGGTPRKLIYDVDTTPGFSPDGTRMAFGRGLPDVGENALVVANADGSQERTLYTQRRFRNPTSPSWSPDGTRIATALADLAGGYHMRLIEVDASTGEQRPIGATRWDSINEVMWLPGGNLLLAAADAPGARVQIWLQPYPDGAPSRVTNDLHSYFDVTATRDGTAVAALQESGRIGLEMDGKPFGGVGNQDIDFRSVDVSRSGSVAYQFVTAAQTGIGMIDGAGAAHQVLIDDSNAFGPAISEDGRFIAFDSEREGQVAHIFVMNADGSGLRRVTDGAGEIAPAITPDGTTIAFMTDDSSLWQVPVAGGRPTRIANNISYPGVAFSPDSKLIAIQQWQSDGNRVGDRLRVLPIAGGAPLLDQPNTRIRRVRWAPAGDGVTFVRDVSGVHNIFLASLKGGEPVQLTQFEEGVINDYDWTADGKLVLARGVLSRDLVLIRDFLAANE